MGSHNDLYVSIECRKKAHQPIDRVFPEITFEEARHLGLGNPHARACLRLGKLPFLRESINLRDDLRFEKMSAGVGQIEIGKNILTSDVNLNFAFQDIYSFRNRVA
jgi:hypothetical protein